MTSNAFGSNYYDLLGIEPNAPAEKIKAIYRLRSKDAYPRREGVGNEELQKQLNQAYEILKDPEKRREYNQQMGLPLKLRALKPGYPIYEEVQITPHDGQAIDVPFDFSRWEPCRRCWGDGCHHCQGKGKILEKVSLMLSIPAGVSQVLVAGQGIMSEPGGSRGDLIVYVVSKR